MSYIVKDNIPQNCAKCPQRTLYRGINVCIASGKMKVSSSNKNRHEKCPLVEIPTPHGRLIDADEIEKCVHEWYDVGEYVFADTIRNADTIIEAEVSEE